MGPGAFESDAASITENRRAFHRMSTKGRGWGAAAGVGAIVEQDIKRLRLALSNLVEAIEFEGEAAHYDTVIKGCVTNARRAINAQTSESERNTAGAYLWDRCYGCGHRLAYASDSCPQCDLIFDDRKEPERWPEWCECERCTKAQFSDGR